MTRRERRAERRREKLEARELKRIRKEERAALDERTPAVRCAICRSVVRAAPSHSHRLWPGLRGAPIHACAVCVGHVLKHYHLNGRLEVEQGGVELEPSVSVSPAQSIQSRAGDAGDDRPSATPPPTTPPAPGPSPSGRAEASPPPPVRTGGRKLSGEQVERLAGALVESLRKGPLLRADLEAALRKQGVEGFDALAVLQKVKWNPAVKTKTGANRRVTFSLREA